MNDKTTNSNKQLVVSLAALIIIAVIVAGITVATKKKTNVAVMSTTSASATPNTANTTSFKNGNYTASGSYNSPGGMESITVKVTLNNGVIADTSAVSGANDPQARQYQSDFISSYRKLVVGKPISSLKLSRVSGSSLTSQGFNSAIQQIENQAKA